MTAVSGVPGTITTLHPVSLGEHRALRDKLRAAEAVLEAVTRQWQMAVAEATCAQAFVQHYAAALETTRLCWDMDVMRMERQGADLDTALETIDEHVATIAELRTSLEASRIRNRGLHARVAALGDALGGAQTLIASADLQAWPVDWRSSSAAGTPIGTAKTGENPPAIPDAGPDPFMWHEPVMVGGGTPPVWPTPDAAAAGETNALSLDIPAFLRDVDAAAAEWDIWRGATPGAGKRRPWFLRLLDRWDALFRRRPAAT